jgi:hypothetical protein
MFLRRLMLVLQAFSHLDFRYRWRSTSCGFPKYVCGKDCDIIVTFLTCSSDVWCMFLRRLMPVLQAFSHLYFGYTWRLEKNILWVPKVCSGLRWWYYCDISDMFLRHLLHVFERTFLFWLLNNSFTHFLPSSDYSIHFFSIFFNGSVMRQFSYL